MKRRNTDCPMLPTQRITLRLGELQTGLSRCNIHWNKLYYMEQIYLSNARNGCRLYYDDGYVEEILSLIHISNRTEILKITETGWLF